jgi:hypothetical protein
VNQTQPSSPLVEVEHPLNVGLPKVALAVIVTQDPKVTCCALFVLQSVDELCAKTLVAQKNVLTSKIKMYFKLKFFDMCFCFNVTLSGGGCIQRC